MLAHPETNVLWTVNIIYNILTKIVGKYFINAWKYSCQIGVMPDSHCESVIVLIPKEGKDLSDIGNWRPITLSNTDAKIITKALTMRMAKVVDEITFYLTFPTRQNYPKMSPELLSNNN